MPDDRPDDDSIWSEPGPSDPAGGRSGPRAAPRRPPSAAAAHPPARPDAPAPHRAPRRPIDRDGGAPAPARPVRRRPWPALLIVFAVGAVVGGAVVGVLSRDDDGGSVAAGAGASTTTAVATTTASKGAEEPADPTTTATPAAPTTAAVTPPGSVDPLVAADALGPIPEPSDCGLPLDDPESLPNADRSYRGGVHEGIDFICGEHGRTATTPLAGKVLVADSSFTDPEPDERVAILDIAKATGHTPPWTLAMLFGRFVVIDHGNIPGVGHVVTIYAHLEEIDPAVRPGADLAAGARVGEIGNRGTESAGTGEARPQAIHLHWEIHIDDRFLGDGLSYEQTRAVYQTLFGV